MILPRNKKTYATYSGPFRIVVPLEFLPTFLPHPTDQRKERVSIIIVPIVVRRGGRFLCFCLTLVILCNRNGVIKQHKTKFCNFISMGIYSAGAACNISKELALKQWTKRSALYHSEAWIRVLRDTQQRCTASRYLRTSISHECHCRERIDSRVASPFPIGRFIVVVATRSLQVNNKCVCAITWSLRMQSGFRARAVLLVVLQLFCFFFASCHRHVYESSLHGTVVSVDRG